MMFVSGRADLGRDDYPKGDECASASQAPLARQRNFAPPPGLVPHTSPLYNLLSPFNQCQQEHLQQQQQVCDTDVTASALRFQEQFAAPPPHSTGHGVGGAQHAQQSADRAQCATLATDAYCHPASSPPLSRMLHQLPSASLVASKSHFSMLISRPPSSSPGQSAQRSSTWSPLSTKRHRAESEAEQRLERRRAQHRVVDAARRQREHDAIDRLQQLLKEQQHAEGRAGVKAEDAEEVAEDDDYVDGAEGSKRAKRMGSGTGRLMVLESSIALIEQLTDACNRMEAACNARDALVSHVSSHLHSVAGGIAEQTVAASSSSRTALSLGDEPVIDPFGYALPSPSGSSPLARSKPSPHSPSFLSVLPPPTASYLAHSDRSHSLNRGGLSFFSPSLCIAVLAPPGVILHLNDRFLDCTGWRRSELLMTSFERNEQAKAPLSPLADIKRGSDGCAGTGSRLSRYMPQYPASMESVMAVIRGLKQMVTGRWRIALRDGSVVEYDSTFWAVHDQPSLAKETWCPDRIVFVFELDDAIKLEPADVRS